MVIASPPTPGGTTNGVNVETMLPTWLTPPLAVIAPCRASTSTAPPARAAAMAIAATSLYETRWRTMRES